MISSFLKRRSLLKKTKGTRSNKFLCSYCKEPITNYELKTTLYTCPHCHKLLQMPSDQRLQLYFDEVKEITEHPRYKNPLDFEGYKEKITKYKKQSKMEEAIRTAQCKLNGSEVMVAVMDSRFMMGSMGSFVGEQITRVFEIATEKKLPVIVFSASGGARMQEGIFSLMQMAKTSHAVERHSLENLLYICVMTHPTTGGVTASFASLGDIIIAEQDALIGFAGQRVIKDTINEDLPEGFQRAEYLESHGFVDMVCNRVELKEQLDKILQLHRG